MHHLSLQLNHACIQAQLQPTPSARYDRYQETTLKSSVTKISRESLDTYSPSPEYKGNLHRKTRDSVGVGVKI